MLVPEVVVKLNQGVGRLVRSPSDRGIGAILDPRILTKPYRVSLDPLLSNSPRMVEIPG